LNCRYVIGTVNEDKNVIEFVEATAIRMSHTLKASKPKDSKLIKEKSYTAKNELGQTFGTKKRQKLIKQQEMNQVRAENMNDVSAKIKETIADNAGPILLKADIDIQTMADRLIPTCDTKAVDPARVYNIDDIFNPAVIRTVDVKQIWKSRTLEECFALLAPLDLGSFLRNKITAVLMEKKDKNLLRTLMIVAYMFKMYTLSERFVSSPDLGPRHLNGASAMVTKRLQELFLEEIVQGAKSKFKRGDKMKDKLLIFSLCMLLIVNNYSIEISGIAVDLKISVNTVQKAVRELGARVEHKKVDGKTIKLASLLLPLQFPHKTRVG